MNADLSLIATCSSGLEELLAAEINRFSSRQVALGKGAVTWLGDLQEAYRACLWSRFASRLLVVLDRFAVKDTDALYEGVRAMQWSSHLSVDNSLAVDCVLSNSTITHSHFAALRVKDAVVDYFRDKEGQRPAVDSRQPDIRLHLYLKEDMAQLSLDLSGASLHRRGYRLEGGQAPLKESLAAAIVSKAGVTAAMADNDIVLDPMCGSATLLIEAAQIIGDVAPGLDRRYFGFLKWRGHQGRIWQELVNEAMAREEAGLERPWPRLLGFDADPAAIKVALANIDRAGLTGKIHVERRQLARLRPPTHMAAGFHLLVTNPPYGERLSTRDEVKYLYRCLGRLAGRHFVNWRLAVFAGNPDLLDALGQENVAHHRFFNGPISCTLRLHEVQAPTVGQGPWRLSSAPPASPLANRLKKNIKPLLKWAAKEKISCLRIYDRDMPEYNVTIDLYGPWILIREYAAPASVSKDKARDRRREIVDTLTDLLDCKRNRIFFKSRERQPGRSASNGKQGKVRLLEVEEAGCRFLVNLGQAARHSGLSLEQRSLRLRIRELAEGRRFLNLFCSTGAATVHAAMAGARSITSVDPSATALAWTRKNLILNGFDPQRHKLDKADCLSWLRKRQVERYDLIHIAPTSLVQRGKEGSKGIDIQEQHGPLIAAAMALLEENGLLLFFCHSRKFHLDQELGRHFNILDISGPASPPDFSRSRKSLHAFEIRHRTAEEADHK